jgi:hypothetical protein
VVAPGRLIVHARRGPEQEHRCRKNLEADTIVLILPSGPAAHAMTLDELRRKPWWFRALARASFLTSPIQ